jgi:hypothetical protein
MKHEDMKVGQKVKLVGVGAGHLHWKFKLGDTYIVGLDGSRPGPADADGDVAPLNYAGWDWELVVEEPTVIGKPKLPNYDFAPLTPEAYDRLSPYFAKAPSWATHVGSDEYGIHFFDHHPHVFPGRGGCAFVKGILPDTHRCKGYDSLGDHATSTLEVLVLPKAVEPVVVEPTVEQLKVEIVTLKAKLWDAEWKLRKIVEVIKDGII